MYIKKIKAALIILCNVSFILALSSCSTLDKKVNNLSQAKYLYPHQCTRNDGLVNHSIIAKLPLNAEELNRLNSTLQENFQLDYGSCVFVGDLDMINKE